eukprot:COSAG05_NODE_525_length_8961_cov_212.374591_7_plen_70_part_00
MQSGPERHTENSSCVQSTLYARALWVLQAGLDSGPSTIVPWPELALSKADGPARWVDDKSVSLCQVRAC